MAACSAVGCTNRPSKKIPGITFHSTTMSNKESVAKLRKTPYFKDVDGFRLPGYFSSDTFRSALKYQPRDDDLFIVSFPKCGTTWMQTIVSCIYRSGKPFDSAMEFFTGSPFLEIGGAEAAETMKRPGAIKIHTPFRLTPWSAKAKYIFVARNPKDSCVSFYHHTVSLKAYNFEDGNFDDYFELFVRGKTSFGDYFDTVMSWYEHRNDPNVLFIAYEQLQKDIRTSILQIAEFMGTKYIENLKGNENILKDVIHNSSYKFLKKSMDQQFQELSAAPKDLILNNPDLSPGIKEMFGKKMVFFLKKNSTIFVRKGIIGDWRNHFSPEQSRRMEEKFRIRAAGTELEDLWKDDMF